MAMSSGLDSRTGAGLGPPGCLSESAVADPVRRWSCATQRADAPQGSRAVHEIQGYDLKDDIDIGCDWLHACPEKRPCMAASILEAGIERPHVKTIRNGRAECGLRPSDLGMSGGPFARPHRDII